MRGTMKMEVILAGKSRFFYALHLDNLKGEFKHGSASP